MTTSPPREVGSYVLEAQLGKGGMGEVYMARHKSLGTRAAVKVMSPATVDQEEFRQRFHREARTQAQLSHPHIARVLDHIEKDGRWYLITELLDGGTLQEVLAQLDGPVEPAQAVRWARQILGGLAFAHQRGVVHRDVKPANILFNDRREAVVTDFGLAKMLEEVGEKLTSTGMSMGTPEYMSPEQILGSAQLDHRTDVYSLGVVLYEMLAGSVPFPMSSVREVHKVLVTPPPPLRPRVEAVGSRLEAIALRALAKEPADRWSTATELTEALAGWEATTAPAAAVAPAPPDPTDTGPTVLLGAAGQAPPPAAVRPAASPRPEDAPPPTPPSPPDAALAPKTGAEPSVSSTYSSPRPRHLLAAAIGVALLLGGLAALWWAGHRSTGETAATAVDSAAEGARGGSAASPSTAAEGRSPAPVAASPVGAVQPPSQPSRATPQRDPEMAPGRAAEVADDGSGAAPELPPSAAAGVEVPAAPAAPPVERQGTRTPQTAATSPSPRAVAPPHEPRVAVLAVGDPLLAEPLAAALEHRLRSLGLDASDARSSLHVGRLSTTSGAVDALDVAPLLLGEGYHLLFFATVEPVSRRDLAVPGASAVAVTSSVRAHLVLLAEASSLRSWADRVEYTSLNAEAKAEASLRGANVEMAEAAREGWRQYREDLVP